MLNMSFFIGHLAADPELGEERDKPVARLRLITNWRGRHGVGHDVIIPGKRGEACAQGLRKGSRIALVGRLRYRRAWNEEEERFERRAEIVTTGDVIFLDRLPVDARSDGAEDADQDLPIRPTPS